MSGFAEYERYDALGLADLVRRRQVTAAELLDAALARVAARNPVINAVTMPLEEYARNAIAAGLPAGPFEGVPFLVCRFEVVFPQRVKEATVEIRDAIEEVVIEIRREILFSDIAEFSQRRVGYFTVVACFGAGLAPPVQRRRAGRSTFPSSFVGSR